MREALRGNCYCFTESRPFLSVQGPADPVDFPPNGYSQRRLLREDLYASGNEKFVLVVLKPSEVRGISRAKPRASLSVFTFRLMPCKVLEVFRRVKLFPLDSGPTNGLGPQQAI